MPGHTWIYDGLVGEKLVIIIILYRSNSLCQYLRAYLFDISQSRQGRRFIGALVPNVAGDHG